MRKSPKHMATLCGLSLIATSSFQAVYLPGPEGKPADMTKPIQVFIIMGQSNTLEMGKATPNLGNRIPLWPNPPVNGRSVRTSATSR